MAEKELLIHAGLEAVAEYERRYGAFTAQERARAVGTLGARAASADIVDASVVEGALRRRDVVVRLLSSDPTDLTATAAAVRSQLRVETP